MTPIIDIIDHLERVAIGVGVGAANKAVREPTNQGDQAVNHTVQLNSQSPIQSANRSVNLLTYIKYFIIIYLSFN